MPEVVNPKEFKFKISLLEIVDIEHITEEPVESLNHSDRFDELTESLKELEEIELECSKENWEGMNELPVSIKTITQARELLIRSASLPYSIQLPSLTPTASGLIEMDLKNY